VTSRAGRSFWRATSASSSAYFGCGLPSEPTTSHSISVRRSTGSATSPRSSCEVIPTCTWRPRLRSDCIDWWNVKARAERVERHVGAAAGCLPDGLPNLLGREAAGVDRSRRALVTGLGELAVVDVDGHHHRVRRRSDLHGRESHTPAPVHRDPLAGLDAPAIGDRAARRHVATAERRGRKAVDPFGEPDAVQVRRGDGDVLRPPAHALDPRDDDVVAEVLEPGAALRARAVGFVEGNGHAVAHLDCAHVAADLLDHTAHLRRGWNDARGDFRDKGA